MATDFDASHIAIRAYWRRIEVREKLGRDVIEFMHWRNMSFRIVYKYDWYFKYRAALLQIKYPKYRVDLIMGNHPAEEKTKEHLENEYRKRKITTAKRMITKISNQIDSYIKEQEATLIPYYDNEHYRKAVIKLNKYKNELKELQND